MTNSTIINREDQLTRYGDAELIEEIYELVGNLPSQKDLDRISDDFYFLLAEALERFAPNVELELRRRGNVDGPEALEYAIEQMAKRHAARLAARAERQKHRDGVDA